MTIVDALQSAQFVVNDEGKRTAVLMDIKAWEQMIDWLETVIDTKIATQALAELESAGGRPAHANWLAWETIREDWNGDEEAPAV